MSKFEVYYDYVEDRLTLVERLSSHFGIIQGSHPFYWSQILTNITYIGEL